MRSVPFWFFCFVGVGIAATVLGTIGLVVSTWYFVGFASVTEVPNSFLWRHFFPVLGSAVVCFCGVVATIWSICELPSYASEG